MSKDSKPWSSTQHVDQEKKQNPVIATNSPIELQCKDCQQPFTFTVGEQKFYETKGFTPPFRCPDCRQKRKQEKESGRPRY